MMVDIAIVGSREFDNYPLFLQVMERLKDKFGYFHLVSGGADGPDTWAEDWIREERRFNLNWPEPTVLRAHWRPDGVYNPRAGLIRNSEIVAIVQVVVAFWDGVSTGTYDTIGKALRKVIPVLIVYPDGRMELR